MARVAADSRHGINQVAWAAWRDYQADRALFDPLALFSPPFATIPHGPPLRFVITTFVLQQQALTALRFAPPD